MLDVLNKEQILKEYEMTKLIRYNCRKRIVDEDLAQHSFFVAMFCLRILAQIPATDKMYKNILSFAILHDAPELLMGDFPHTLKVEYPEIAKALEDVEKDYYKDNWPAYAETFNSLTVLEQEIITLADAYSVAQYTENEIVLGNSTEEMWQIRKNALDRIDVSTDKINELLKED